MSLGCRWSFVPGKTERTIIVIDIRQVATEQPTVPFGRYGRREVDVNDVDRRPENVRIELDAARLFCATAQC